MDSACVFGLPAKTKALWAKILFEVPLDLYSQVTYPVAMTKEGAGNADAKLFYDYIVSDAAHPEMIRLGFTLPE